MPRSSQVYLFFLVLFISSNVFADDRLGALEAVAQTNAKTQPELENFQVIVETPRIAEMLGRMTADIPADVKKPETPVIIKYWSRSPEKNVITTLGKPASPYVEQMVKRASDNLAIELNKLILPATKADQRSQLVSAATIKSSEVELAQTLLQRVEIIFKQPTDLEQAFYLSALRLPQKQIRSLSFDIDAKAQTIGEMVVTTESGLMLTVEIRYLQVTGGYLPKRIHITSPDGKVDDLLEVEFTKVAEFTLPATMQRTIRRLELQDELKITFRDYRINQPAPELPSPPPAQP